ncbi:hypothetical protein [Glaciihabitans sp. dw_435]|uniref:hypothetical protein n=1 Tax=Glaciihabitans sp. dw_435 TaxID=2720081 RepID=UPI001BD5272A|nr:hypothetical protein [Glaciihabitans sp. dw_435]
MTKIVARILIDTEDFEGSMPGTDDHAFVLWRRPEILHAHPFTEHEVSYSTSLMGDEYFV